MRYLVNDVACHTEAIANKADYTKVPRFDTCINEQCGQPTNWLWCRLSCHSNPLQIKVREAIPKKGRALVQSHNQRTCNTNQYPQNFCFAIYPLPVCIFCAVKQATPHHSHHNYLSFLLAHAECHSSWEMISTAAGANHSWNLRCKSFI